MRRWRSGLHGWYRNREQLAAALNTQYGIGNWRLIKNDLQQWFPRHGWCSYFRVKRSVDGRLYLYDPTHD